jgi:hypothetical protein
MRYLLYQQINFQMSFDMAEGKSVVGGWIKVDEPILAGRLKWTPTFEPIVVMIMKETENCLLHNLESQLWAIGCVEIFSSIWMAY